MEIEKFEDVCKIVAKVKAIDPEATIDFTESYGKCYLKVYFILE